MKKKIIIGVSIIIAVCLIGGGAFAASRMMIPVAAVQPVSELDIGGGWGTSDHWMSGTVTTDATQNVYLADGQKIKEIFVEEGQQVKVGDELLSFDTAIKSLELEQAKLELEIIQLRIEGANIDLDILKKEKPYTPPPEPDPEPDPEPEPDPGFNPDGYIDPDLEELDENEPRQGEVQQQQTSVVQSPVTGDMEGEITGRTQEEIDQDIKEKKKFIKEQELIFKEAELNISKLEEDLKSQAVLTSAVNGTVKKLEDPDEWQLEDGRPFMIVNSEEGLYVKGTINELERDIYQPGAILMGDAWESQASFMAEIKEISEYPAKNSFSYGKNPNSSNYVFLAQIQDDVQLSNGEWVELNLMVEEAQSEYICIEIMYVRQEEGQYYVYIADENGRLKKQYVTVSRKIYGWAYEITEGLSTDDLIAFPYGKTAKEGAKTINRYEEMYSEEEVD